MPDRFATHTAGLDAPAQHGFAVTPHDDNDLPETTRALFVGGGGNLSVIMASGTTLTFSGVPAGSILAIRAQRVRATATTATLIVGLV